MLDNGKRGLSDWGCGEVGVGMRKIAKKKKVICLTAARGSNEGVFVCEKDVRKGMSGKTEEGCVNTGVGGCEDSGSGNTGLIYATLTEVGCERCDEAEWDDTVE